MPLGYEMITIQHTISGETQEIYARDSAKFLEDPWFSQFYVIQGAAGSYGSGPYGSGPYGNE